MKETIINLLLFLTASCTLPSGEGCDLQVHLHMPGEYSKLTTEGTAVKLINTGNGTIYTSYANASGVATFHAEYGIYRLSAQLKFSTGDIEYLFNGGQENIRLTPQGNPVTGPLSITLNSSKRSRIIIKEIYYSGCYDDNGKQYIRDSYVSLYNNSDTTVWLDSLCIGTVAPIVANQVSPWLTHNADSLPISYMGWQFPGNGNEHPLEPGETTTIAINAVDHSGKEYNHPNSVNLSKAAWAFYHPSLTQQDISNGVALLNLFKKIGTPRSYTFTIAGTSLVIYRTRDISATAYGNNPANIRKAPPQFTGVDYLVIPSAWVVDGIDCVEDATKQGFKRLPSFIDAEAAYLPSGKYSGRSLHRRIAETRNGRIIYQDTNNSFNDLEETIPTMKEKQ